MDENQFPRLDKTVFSVVSSFEEADQQDKEYWLSKTPLERLQHMELLRRINYGADATARLQRVLEVAERDGDDVQVIERRI
jgi:hypothetical protein